MYYFIKIHPTCITLLPNQLAPRVFDHDDLYVNVANTVASLCGPTNIILEKPYLSIQQDTLTPSATRIATSIIKTQRTYGALVYAIQTTHPSTIIREISSAAVRSHLFPNTKKVSKDFLLNLVNAKYGTFKAGLSPIQELCIADALLLQTFYESMSEAIPHRNDD